MPRTKQDIADTLFGTGIIPLNQPDLIDLPLQWWETLEHLCKEYEVQIYNYSFLKDFVTLAGDESIVDYFLDSVGNYLIGANVYDSSHRNDVYHFLYNPKSVIQYKENEYINPFYKSTDGFPGLVNNTDLPKLNEFICHFF